MSWQSLESERATPAGSALATRHAPVLLSETLLHLGCSPGKNFADLTLGGGGHAEAILRATAPDGILCGADRDTAAVARTRARLAPFGSRVSLRQGSFREIDALLELFGARPVDGALVDCGLSSDQLGDPGRGFSFLEPGPLDMRMDPGRGFTAEEWLCSAAEEEISAALWKYGEERYARRIARALVRYRKTGPLKTTEDLARIVRQAVPPRARHLKTHPATRTFQAVRILVNDELAQIEFGLSSLLERLPRGARIVVLTFHSLEDRIAKTLFRDARHRDVAKILTKKPVLPAAEEIGRNPRARSAKLRAVEIEKGEA